MGARVPRESGATSASGVAGASGGSGAATPHGLCVRRVPNKPVVREVDGRIAIHLWLRQDRRFDGDVALRLSPAEAEILHAQLCYVLGDLPPTGAVTREPECRTAGPPPSTRAARKSG